MIRFALWNVIKHRPLQNLIFHQVRIELKHFYFESFDIETRDFHTLENYNTPYDILGQYMSDFLILELIFYFDICLNYSNIQNIWLVYNIMNLWNVNSFANCSIFKIRFFFFLNWNIWDIFGICHIANFLNF